MDDDELLTPEEATAEANLPDRYLEQARYRREGPAYIKFGARTIRYRRSDLRAWMAQHRVEPQGAA